MPNTNELLWHRWDEVDQLLNEVLDVPTERRASHLARYAGTDPALHDLVLRLLERVARDSHRLDGPSESVVLGAFSDDSGPLFPGDLEPGTTVGRYVVIERRGRGGMATVYEAGRSDGAFEQRVALKVLRRGLDTDDLILRFLNERQILSSLTHPNIARLLDGGSLADGRPYLVMDLVDGTPITAFADARRLDLTTRLTLFLDVASAVNAAHRQLVVHRDIKPSNILVNDDGQATLLDFGIAKLLEGDPGQTAPGATMLTPDYASPEQVHGGPITTGTDIYQLGLLLRELLTGLRPLAGDTSPGEPPIHPSRVATLAVAGAPEPDARAEVRDTTPAQLARALSGELDIIVNKALRPDPDERYASAEELAADIRRYIKGLPILAHPESRGYLLRKFVARNPMILPTALAAIVAIAGFITVLVIQNSNLARQRDVAEAASQRTKATEEFLVDILRSPDPTFATDQVSPKDLKVVDALQRGRVRINAELKGQPEVGASILAAIGRTFTGLGQFDVADTLLRQSLAQHRELYGVADSRSLEVLRALGDNSRDTRDMRTADSIYSEELRFRTGAGPVSDTVLVSLLGMLSSTRLDLGDVDSSLVLVTRAVRMLQSVGDTSGFRYTGALGHLARALRGAKRLDSAEIVYREIIRRMALESAPNLVELATTHNNLGYLLRTRGISRRPNAPTGKPSDWPSRR